MDNWTNKNS